MKEPFQLYHGSPRPLEGTHLQPSLGDDSEERPENNQLAVYAADRRDLALVMAMFACSDVTGGSLDEYKDGTLQGKIYGRYPSQKYIWLHHLPSQTFTQTKIDSHQYVSLVPVRPIKTEKVLVADIIHLVPLGTQEETDRWVKKYGTKK